MSANRVSAEPLESRIYLAFTTFNLPIPGAKSLTPSASAPQLTAGPGNSIWLAYPAHARIVRLDTNGAVHVFNLRKESQPTAITAGRRGTIWFLNAGYGKVGEITSSGLVREFRIPAAPKKPYEPLRLTLGPDGNI